MKLELTAKEVRILILALMRLDNNDVQKGIRGRAVKLTDKILREVDKK